MKRQYSKITSDANSQSIEDGRIAVLPKSDDHSKFAVHEDNLKTVNSNELIWSWTDFSKMGLQGRRIKDGFCVYRWYPNQKQLFERFKLLPPPPT